MCARCPDRELCAPPSCVSVPQKHHEHMEAVREKYKHIQVPIDGDRETMDVFEDIAGEDSGERANPLTDKLSRRHALAWLIPSIDGSLRTCCRHPGGPPAGAI